MALTTENTAGLVPGKPTQKPGSVRVKIVRPTVAAGRPVSAGEVIEVSEAEARVLLNLYKAMPISESIKADHREKDIVARTSTRDAKSRPKQG